MIEYLSQEWIEAVDRELRANRDLEVSCSEANLVLQQIITGGPAGDIAFAVTLHRDGARATPGLVDHAHVRLKQTLETASAIYRGESNALDAIQQGQILLAGDTARLLNHREQLSLLEDCFAAIRPETTTPS